MLFTYCSIRRDGDRARDDVAPVPRPRLRRQAARRMLERIAPAGTPDEVVARFQAYVDAGVRHFVVSPGPHRRHARGRHAGRRRGPAPADAAGGRRRDPVTPAPTADGLPCAGLSVVEVAVGVTDLGLGLAGGVPGMMLADLGAAVTRVVGTGRVARRRRRAVGAGLAPRQAGRRHRRPRRDPRACSARPTSPSSTAPRPWSRAVASAGTTCGTAPRARLRPLPPSRTAAGDVDDYGLLVEARSGFCTQLAGHRPGPIFVDVRAPGAGAALLLTTSVLALLRRRALTGAAGGPRRRSTTACSPRSAA